MKLTKIISLVLVLVMILTMLASCNLEDIITGIMGSTTTQPTTSGTPTTDKGDNGDPEDDKDAWDEQYEIITIAEALEIAKKAGQDGTSDRYYIRGTIETISNPSYGEMTISDETGSIYVYGTYSHDGELKFPEIDETPVKGDEVLLHCILSTYNDSPQVKNARLIDFISVEVPPSVNPDDYTEMAIVDARDAAVGTLIKITGVVAQITYANGMKPSGVYLVDGTNSIYVYDGDIASQVKIGNKITVLGEKDMWILETEKSSAEKHGYKGCCQLSSAILYENGKGSDEIDFSWCEEKTVKEIVNIPVTENVTTTIFKTTALVKKVPGNGFVNYYIDDLDGKTGTYVYTQCNGSDFAWLDKFDGKICTVYYSLINAKSESSKCTWRALPVAVIDEGFEFDLSNTAEHVVEYYGVDQFLSNYTGNPKLEVVTSVDSELLGFEGATLTYSSSNTSIAYFEEVDGKLVFNVVEESEGYVTITITGTYGEYTHSRDIDITVGSVGPIDSITIGEVIDAEVGEIVTVEGIIGPSLVNKDGFYLISENGVIAVVVNDSSVWAGLEIGQKVVIQGKRDKWNKEGGKGYGVTCITSATVVANYYGSHEYSTESFITDKTLDDFYALNVDEDHSTEVYVAVGQILVEETAYYTNIKLKTPNGKQVTLYCSSANQYNWLKQFSGEDITVEIVPCNWNGKSYWAGCVIAVRTADGKVYNELNFDINK